MRPAERFDGLADRTTWPPQLVKCAKIVAARINLIIRAKLPEKLRKYPCEKRRALRSVL
jgi:hypothetical protein